ncbi:AAA family ATPase [Actinoplanes sp. NPDC051411]|uniref:AAA family ATPase n=1 Tax=Actinoplanes sp. NPDC051411 TaxID=3155522 RepID=UPI00341C8F3F
MSELVGRTAERAGLDHLLAAARTGESRALLLRGEEGIGKTALLDHLAGRATGCRIVRAAAVPSEQAVEFAALHQLCAPLLDRLDCLPLPQRDAVGVVFGLRAGAAPDRLLVGLAVLGLLAEHARSQPLLCLIDDAQWLDPASAQVLGLAARRVRAESLAVVFASRDSRPELDGLPVLSPGGLSDEEARALLAAAGWLEPVDDRVIAECHGNPLALLETAKAGCAGLPGTESGWLGAAALPGRIEEWARQGCAGLDAAARLLLMVAAIEPGGDPALVGRATARLGAQVDAEAPAGPDAGVGWEALAGLVEFGDRVRFRHPLLRTAVGRRVDPAERRRVHAALAAEIDPAADRVGHLWQRAQAAAGRDDDLADDLAAAGGGPLFLERAAELTTDAGKRGEWLLAAAESRHLSGTPGAAQRLLRLAEAGPLSELAHARADVLRAQGDPALLLKAADRIAPLDAARGRATCLDALRAGLIAGEAPGDDPFLRALKVRSTKDVVIAAPHLRTLLSDVDRADGRELWAGGLAALELGDREAADALTARSVRLAAESGTAAMLPDLLAQRVVSRVYAGALPQAGALAGQLDAVCRRAGVTPPAGPARLLAAWAGAPPMDGDPDEAAVVRLASSPEGEDRRSEGDGRALEGDGRALEGDGRTLEGDGRALGDDGRGLPGVGWDDVRAVRWNGLGRYEEAYAVARGGCWPGLVERLVAAAHLGRNDVGGLRRLNDAARAAGSDGLLGLAALGRAMLGGQTLGGKALGGKALGGKMLGGKMLGGREDAYREALALLERAGMRGYLGRAHLYYGEWLWAADRHGDARARLRTAYEMMRESGLLAFADLAGARLGVAGRKRPDAGLTAQETQIVRLARDGLSNVEIASRLFLSPRTVEWHLGKVFTKLGISSRRQLLRGTGPWRSGEWGGPRSASA